MSSRRPCDSDALATSSYGTNFAHPLSAATFVRAAVKVVLPWSMWPIVPTFTCGFVRSNFSLAMNSALALDELRLPRYPDWVTGADDQNRTGDLVLTKDALCRLSYIGPISAGSRQRAVGSESGSQQRGERTPRLHPIARCNIHCPLPAACCRLWSGRRGSNPRPTAWKAVTLPLSYSRLRGSRARHSALRQASPPSPNFP